MVFLLVSSKVIIQLTLASTMMQVAGALVFYHVIISGIQLHISKLVIENCKLKIKFCITSSFTIRSYELCTKAA